MLKTRQQTVTHQSRIVRRVLSDTPDKALLATQAAELHGNIDKRADGDVECELFGSQTFPQGLRRWRAWYTGDNETAPEPR